MDEALIRSWLDQRTVGHEFSGVALVWVEGAPVFSYAGGLAVRGHGLTVTEESRFAVASITKMATAVAALRLVDRGSISLDSAVVELLPQDQCPQALTPRHTLAHLLSHTSGLANYHDDEDETWNSFTSCWDRIPTYHVRRPADMLPLFKDLPGLSDPGETFQYCDTNFILVGLVLEAATGLTYAEVVATEVFGPAGMPDTGIEALDDDPPRLATGYMTDSGPYESWRSNVFGVTANGMPDGGMITTATDLASFIDAIVGGLLLSPEMTAAMTSPQGPESIEIEQYGFGCEVALENGKVKVIGHAGSDPGVSAVVSHYVSQETTIAVLCNQDRGSWAVTQHLGQELGLEDPRS
ncbi:serine hydrolase domain-containing protein [soil metagenome]